MVSSFILAICHSFRRMSSSTSPFPTTVNFVWQKKRSGIVTVLFLVDNDDIDYQDKLSHYPVPKPIECCMEKEEELTRDCAIPSCQNWRCHKQWNQEDQDELKHFPIPKHSAIHMEKEEEWESICAIPPHHCLLPQMAKPKARMSLNNSPFLSTVNFVWQKRRSGLLPVLLLIDKSGTDAVKVCFIFAMLFFLWLLPVLFGWISNDCCTQVWNILYQHQNQHYYTQPTKLHWDIHQW